MVSRIEVAMTKLIAIIIIVLTCATLHAQSVIVKGTGAGNVRGAIATATNVSSVLTNLSVTGTLNPDVTGTNYVQITDTYGYPRWYNSANGYYIYFEFSNYYIATNGTGVASGAYWSRLGGDPQGSGAYGAQGTATGTATNAYWYQTNFISTVSVRGKATP